LAGTIAAGSQLPVFALTLLPLAVQMNTGEVIGTYISDLRLIKAGIFRLPWDMTTIGHRQFDPFYIAKDVARTVGEFTRVLSSRARGTLDTGKLPFGMSNMYPSYYQNNFHFQTGAFPDLAEVYCHKVDPVDSCVSSWSPSMALSHFAPFASRR
jgi:hypothetical protein